MKNQHFGAFHKTFVAGRVLFLLMLVTVFLCAFSLGASAEDPFDPMAGAVYSVSFAEESGIAYNQDITCWVKEYDGESFVDLSHVNLEIYGETDTKKATLISAQFLNTAGTEAAVDVGDAILRVSYEWDGTVMEYDVPAKIAKKRLSWNNYSIEADLHYNANKPIHTHTFTSADIAAIPQNALVGILPGDAGSVSVGAINSVSLSASEISGGVIMGHGIRTYTSVVLIGERAFNYSVDNMEIKFNVLPMTITEVVWGIDGEPIKDGKFEFFYGDEDSLRITAMGKIGEDSYRELTVMLKGTKMTLDQAAGTLYGFVSDKPYVLCAVSPESRLFVLDGTFEASVTFEKALCIIGAEDVTFQSDAEHSPIFYPIPITNIDGNVPADVFARIKYQFTLDGKTFTSMPDGPGEYTVVFSLDPSDAENYTLEVREPNGGKQITAEVLPYRLTVGFEEGGADVIVFSGNGDVGGIAGTLLQADISEELLKPFTVYKSLRLSLSGLEKGEMLTIYIPVHSDLLSDDRTKPLTDSDLYIFDGEKLTAAKGRFRVQLSDDGSYYLVQGIKASDTVLDLTFLIAPAAPVSFWVTAPGIALIVFLILLALLALVLIGIKLLRMEKKGKNPVLKIDTEGGAKKPGPAVAPEKLGDADACIEKGLDALAVELSDQVSPEEEKLPDVNAEEAVDSAMKETLASAQAIRLTDDADERDIEEITQMTEDMAEEMAEEMADRVEAEEETVDADAALLGAAVGETIKDVLNDAEAITTDEPAKEAATPDLAAVRAAIDAIVVDALATVVDIPDGLAEKSADSDVGEDACAIAQSVAKEALRAIMVDGQLPKPFEGKSAQILANAVRSLAQQHLPKELSEDERAKIVKAVADELSRALF